MLPEGTIHNWDGVNIPIAVGLLGADLVGYPLFYLRRRDVRGLASWASRYAGGMRGRGFGGPR